METGLLLAFTNPTSDEEEDAYNRWYAEEHLPHILAVAGIQTARRLVLDDRQWDYADPLSGADSIGSRHRYLAVYEVAADDLGSVIDDMRARFEAGSIPPSALMQHAPPPITLLFKDVT